MHSLIKNLLPAEDASAPSGWLWPRVELTQAGLAVTSPVRRGTYDNCLMVQAYVHQMLRHDTHFTLHSSRLYLPGHWRPRWPLDGRTQGHGPLGPQLINAVGL